MKAILVLSAVTMFVVVSAHVFDPQTATRPQAGAPDPAVRYQTLFYPAGMPVCDDPENSAGEQIRATFRFYGETALAATGPAAVLYSEDCEPKPKTGSDFGHALYLAVVQAKGEQLRVMRIHNLTEMIPIDLEEPGQVAVLDALLEAFGVSKRMVALHVHIWARLSGSGNISQARDIFYRPEKDGGLSLLLDLKETSKFERSGACDWLAGDSIIGVADRDDDSSQELTIESGVTELKDCRQSWRGEVNVYKFNGEKYQLFSSQQRTSPEGGIAPSHVLKRSKLIIYPEPRNRR